MCARRWVWARLQRATSTDRRRRRRGLAEEPREWRIEDMRQACKISGADVDAAALQAMHARLAAAEQQPHLRHRQALQRAALADARAQVAVELLQGRCPFPARRKFGRR